MRTPRFSKLGVYITSCKKKTKGRIVISIRRAGRAFRCQGQSSGCLEALHGGGIPMRESESGHIRGSPVAIVLTKASNYLDSNGIQIRTSAVII